MKIKELSIVILTNNKDDKFTKAYKSASFANEIIVVENHEPINDFSKVRNEALKSVKTEWVLFLDSDEILPKDAELEINYIVEKNVYDAIFIQRNDYFLGKPLLYGETGFTSIIRLFKTKKGKFVRNVHEVVEITGKIGGSKFAIQHFSHNSIKEFMEKVAKYAILESKNKKLSQNEIIIELVLFPPLKFILNYIFKFGFLDGYRGFIYAILMSMHSFFVRVYYYENDL